MVKYLGNMVKHPGNTNHQGLTLNNLFPRTKHHRVDCPYLISDLHVRIDASAIGLVYKGSYSICDYQQNNDIIPDDMWTQELYIGESFRSSMSEHKSPSEVTRKHLRTV